MAALKLEKNNRGRVTRGQFEDALFEAVTKPGHGWNGTFAMVTLGIMFLARAVGDVAEAIGGHAAIMRGRR